MNDRAVENLRYWTSNKSLPEHFPILIGTPPPGGYWLRDEGADLVDIGTHIVGSFRSAIIFPPGQGTTTLLNEFVRRKRVNNDVFQLFVILDIASNELEDFGNSWVKYTATRIITQLVENNWRNRLKGQNKQNLVSIFDFETDKQFNDMAIGLASKRAHALKEIEHVANSWSKPNRLSELFKRLSSSIGINVVLCFDFPHSATDETIYDVVSAIKWFDENDKDDDFPPTAMREAYFLTRDQVSLVKSTWTVEFLEMEFRPYAQIDVFSILSHHFGYEGSLGSRNSVLSGIFSDAYIAKVWREHIPLKELSTAMRSEILKDMDIPRSQVRHMLAPRGNV